MMPTDKDAREKYEATKKEFKLRKLAECLNYNDTKVEVNVNDIVVDASYVGPRLDDGADNITSEWV
jgi:hypothetical protein